MTKGFDIVIGNPPYGQNSVDEPHRKILKNSWNPSVLGKKSEGGSYNLSAVFIERSASFLKGRGSLGFIVNNSIARVDEFKKTRDFLKDETFLKEIVDEGNPFRHSNVTLEMITLILRNEPPKDHPVRIVSHREGREGEKYISSSVLDGLDKFVLYHDEMFQYLHDHCRFGVLHGTRGRDLAHKDQLIGDHTIPYYHSGKSVHKYRTILSQLDYVNENVLEKDSWKDEYDETMVVATKITDRYRVTFKPKGMLVGNNVVKITQDGINMDEFALMGILNSALMDYIVHRYLINYSKLTVAFYDSITMATPVIVPDPDREVAIKDLSKYLFFCRTELEDHFNYLKGVLDCVILELYFEKKFRDDGIYHNGDRLLYERLSDYIIPVDCEKWFRINWEHYFDDVSNESVGLDRLTESMGKTVKEACRLIQGDETVLKLMNEIQNHEWVKKLKVNLNEFNRDPKIHQENPVDRMTE